MPRTDKDIAYTDECAADCHYVAPPVELEPKGKMLEDKAWRDLGDWFEMHTHSWSTAIKVYVSRRYDTSIQEVYCAADTFFKYEWQRREDLEDPDAKYSRGN